MQVQYGNFVKGMEELIKKRSYQTDVYVTRKAWICAIPGLSCANPGSMVCGTNHGLAAQSWDCSCAKHGSGQSWDCPAQSIDQTCLHVIYLISDG